MLINRVRAGSPENLTLLEAASLVGVEAPFFFLDASTVDIGSNTWTDSLGGRVGTFENAGFSVVTEGARQFVRLGNCRCAFPTSVLQASDTGVTLVAKVRPTAGNATNRMLVAMPRTTSATYSWYVQFNTAHTVTHYTYHGSTADTRTYSRGMPKSGDWGLVTLGKYAYPPSDYIAGSAEYIATIAGAMSDAANVLRAAFTLHSTSELPFIVGGGRATGGTGIGTIANAFAGDIEWLALWKTPIDARKMEALRAALEKPPVVRNRGYGFPPKRERGRITYVDTSAVGKNYNGSAVETFVSANSYSPGAIVSAGGRVRKIMGPRIRSSQTYWLRDIEGTRNIPCTAVTAASAKMRNGEVVAICASPTGDSTGTLDGAINATPSSPYSDHIPVRVIKVLPYNRDSGSIVETGRYRGTLTVKNGVFNVSGLMIDPDYFNGIDVLYDPSLRTAIACTDSLLFVDRCTLSRIQTDGGTVFAHDCIAVGDNSSGPQYSSASGSTSINTYRQWVLGAGGYRDTGSVQVLRGYADVGYSRLASSGCVAAAMSAKVAIANSAVDTMLAHASGSEPHKYVPLLRTETPGGVYMEWLGGSVDRNCNLVMSTPYVPLANSLQSEALVSIEVIAGTTQTSGGGGSNRDIGVEDTGIYMPAYAAYFDRAPFSYVTYFTQIVESYYENVGRKPHDPSRTRNFIEYQVDILAPGERTFEIDFMAQTEDDSVFLVPRGFLSVAAFYYDPGGQYRIYRDAVLRPSLSTTGESPYTLTQKVAASNWVSNRPMGIAGSRTFTLPDVSTGRLRLQVHIGVITTTLAINPIVKVT